MTTRKDSSDAADPVQAALDAYGEAWMEGERFDPDAFCANHPDCEEALRRKIVDFLYVAERLPYPDKSDGNNLAGGSLGEEGDGDCILG